MSRLQLINKFLKGEITKIIDSIDHVFFDIDGVLVHNKTLIPGAIDCVQKLRTLGKKIAFVTNNAVYPIEKIEENLKHFGAQRADIVTPNDSLLYYLKHIGYKKDVYAICGDFTKKLLREAGYNVIEYKDMHFNELYSLSEIEKLSVKALEVCKNVGVVHVDLDFNFNFGAIQVAQIILSQIEDVSFLTGARDDLINLNANMKLTGPRYYIEGLERWTRRKPIPMAKPGFVLKDQLCLKFNIQDQSRVLFIGDNVDTDITFGVNCGFQTCLVLSGVTSKQHVEEWPFSEASKPTYVSQDIGEFYDKIKDL